ncbi:uncharacterized protein CANTADRAFT_104483 [Suhomyces tanzawaensis NRRL Y-17324]|uniref:RRM domain-containing protein n=1 Tax=Suhomyces tanzawaensis NRRL Y-17324 TaxID=984487 RepID=A0A1E4SPB4_9ASCO|nr:uncharacterized protein CANTADRAFT_104483 [Suhomyces tanzawaensis NRRL Y-17324]ODV81353.1 hypothetical protein CANTADRAFT_104483 [Suhomyces tanzawaensis NRRL Y-17324]
MVRLSNTRRRHFGVAYAEFADQDTVDRVINAWNGKKLHGRVLSVKQHKPVVCARHLSSQDPLEQSRDNGLGATRSPLEGDLPTVSGVPKESCFTASDDTIFIPRAYRKVTENEIRDFFDGYNIRATHIVRPKTSSRRIGFRPWFVSIFVTLETNFSLSEVINSLKKKRLCGNAVYLKPAYQEKYDSITRIKQRVVKYVHDKVDPSSAQTTAIESSESTSTDVPIENADGAGEKDSPLQPEVQSVEEVQRTAEAAVEEVQAQEVVLREEVQALEEVFAMEETQSLEEVRTVETTQSLEEVIAVDEVQVLEELLAMEEVRPLEEVRALEEVFSVDKVQVLEELLAMEEPHPLEEVLIVKASKEVTPIEAHLDTEETSNASNTNE